MYNVQEGVDDDLALLPFKPMAMKVLQCSFLSGIRQGILLLLVVMLLVKWTLFSFLQTLSLSLSEFMETSLII